MPGAGIAPSGWARRAGSRVSLGYDASTAQVMKKFPDFVPPTKVSYLDRGPTLQIRRCMLQAVDDPAQEWTFDKEEIRIGSMEDNDVVLGDDTVSRYHCRITQEDNGYVLFDQRSTNGTFINKVRIREAFVKSGSIVSVGQ